MRIINKNLFIYTVENFRIQWKEIDTDNKVIVCFVRTNKIENHGGK